MVLVNLEPLFRALVAWFGTLGPNRNLDGVAGSAAKGLREGFNKYLNRASAVRTS